MKVKFFVALAISAMLTLSITAAGLAKRPTHIRIDHWVAYYAGSDQAHHAPPGGTLTHCASEVVTDFGAVGPAKRAVEDSTFKVRYLLNGQKYDVSTQVWTKGGRVHFADGLHAESGVPDGNWVQKETQHGKTIGYSKLTLATDPSC